MTTLIEAAKQALEALEEWEKPMSKGSLEAHRILRTAIEQAEKQEPVAWMFQHDETGRMNYVSNDGLHNPSTFLEMNPRYALVCPLYATPPAAQPAPVQEPVADEDELSNGFALALHDAVLIRIGKDDEATRQAIARIDKLVAKYTSDATPPAARREWVDLTDEDIESCYGGEINDFARAVIDKFKGKNT
jgi:hypothetical protein